jgi:hypothetical protein
MVEGDDEIPRTDEVLNPPPSGVVPLVVLRRICIVSTIGMSLTAWPGK